MGLRVSSEETQAIWFHSGTKREAPSINVRRGTLYVGGKAIQIRDTMKYLSLVLDGRWTFEDHFELLAPRLERTVVALCWSITNIGGPDERVRRLYAVVIHPMALYGAPVWAADLMARDKSCARLASVWRRPAIRVVRGYRTLSHEAAAVRAGLPPLDLLAGMEATIYDLVVDRAGSRV